MRKTTCDLALVHKQDPMAGSQASCHGVLPIPARCRAVSSLPEAPDLASPGDLCRRCVEGILGVQPRSIFQTRGDPLGNVSTLCGVRLPALLLPNRTLDPHTDPSQLTLLRGRQRVQDQLLDRLRVHGGGAIEHL
jgi:hypothetical protein